MSTRRALLTQACKTAAMAAVPQLPAYLIAAAQPPPGVQQPGKRATDEMTVNSAPQPEHYPQPDFGPAPLELPPEYKAIRGNNSLRAHAQQHGLIAGAALAVRSLEKDLAMQDLVADQYGILVPENDLKWRALRPTLKDYDFSASDALFAFAAKHKMLVRAHTLVWHNSVPDWLRNHAPQTDVRQLFVEHIRTVVSRYRGRVHSWDVVNEAILAADSQPNGMRKSFWYESVGPDYIELAFRTAHDADPQAKMTYNDYGVEYDSDEQAERRKHILALVQRLRRDNVPLDAVGIQSHIKAGSPYSIGHGLADYIASIHSMGLEVYLTEMDVNEDDLPFDDVVRRDQAVAATYRKFLDVALASPAVKLVLTWGVSDRRTWLNDGPTHHRKQPNRPQRSLPFDVQYRPTPAFFAIRDAIDHRSQS